MIKQENLIRGKIKQIKENQTNERKSHISQLGGAVGVRVLYKEKGADDSSLQNPNFYVTSP